MKKKFPSYWLDQCCNLRFDLKMKLTTLLLLVCLFQTNAESYSQKKKIDLNLSEVSVQQALDKIESITEFKFFVNTSEIDLSRKVSELKSNNETIDKVLDKLFSGTDVKYEILNKQIIIKKGIQKSRQESPKTNNNLQDTRMLSGTVKDPNGLPLAGVTVLIANTTIGTYTDFDGNFTLEVPATAQKIMFSYVGFISKELAISDIEDPNNIVVTLNPGADKLEEVVVVGYGTQKRREVSSAISSLEGEKIQNNIGNQSSFDRGLQGLIKGVQVTQGSGEPGSGVDIIIRGITSPFTGGNNNPLFVIDGVPFLTNPVYNAGGFTGSLNVENANPLQNINPDDIESIDVLKDASATAIYGSRGTNGVIIVNTKRGRKGQKTNVNFSSRAMFSTPVNLPDYLSTEEWKDYIDLMFRNSVDQLNNGSGYSSFYATNWFSDYGTVTRDSEGNYIYEGLNEDYFGSANTDWADEVYRDPAFSFQNNLSITGGSEKTAFALSLGYLDQEGLLMEDEYDQYNARFTLDHQISKVLKAGFTGSFSYANNRTGYDNINSYLNTEVLNFRPDFPAYDENGQLNRIEDWYFGRTYEFANPVAMTTQYDEQTKSFTTLGSAFLEADIFTGLTLRADVNAARFTNDSDQFNPITKTGFGFPGQAPFGASTLSLVNTDDANVIANLSATYDTFIGDKHKISALLGAAWDRNWTHRQVQSFRGFPDDDVLINATYAQEPRAASEAEFERGINSIYSRLSYNYDQKYFLTLNFRTDRSSRFGPGNQRGYFPSAAASWDIAKESFLEDSDIVKNLRLRVGVGRSGSNNIGDFAYLQFFNIDTRDRGLYNGEQAVGLSGTLPNKDVKWETTDEVNIGLDFSLFDFRITGSVDWYDRYTTGALMRGFYPLESGNDNYIQNFADISNTGIEAELNVEIIRSTDIGWSFGFNIAANDNILEKLNTDGLTVSESFQFEEGRPVFLNKGYKVDGIFQTQAEIDALNEASPNGTYWRADTAPGDYKYADLNGDGEITRDGDYTYLGTSQPDFFGGFSTSFRYKNFELATNFVYSVGGVSYPTAFSSIAGNPSNNIERQFTDSWTPDNTDARYPRTLLYGNFGNTQPSEARLSDLSYLRWQALQLSYSLPNSITDSLGVNDLSIIISGNNLWTLTDFVGLDPAAIGPAASRFSQFTSSPYPISQTWSLGLNLNF